MSKIFYTTLQHDKSVFEDGTKIPHSYIDIFWNIENKPNLLKNVITCDESLFYKNNPKSKCQYIQWNSPSLQRQKKVQQSKSKFKVTMVFFTLDGMFIWTEYLIVNQICYKEVLTTLCEWIRRRWPEMWKDDESFTKTTDQHIIPVCEDIHSEAQDHHVGMHTALTRPYSKWLSLFPHFKSVLKGTKFEFMVAVKVKAIELINTLSEENLQHCFQQRKIYMEWYRYQGGE